MEPYLFIQGNYLQRTNFNIVNRQYNYRPGIGFVTHSRARGLLTIKGTFQMGYTISKESFKPNAMVIEVKLGIGFDFRKWRARKRPENLESNSIEVNLL